MASRLSPEYLAQDRRPQARIGISVVTVLSGIVVLVRVYARCKIIRSFGYDDGLICVAMLINIAIMALTFQVLRYGAGLHIASLSASDVPYLYKWLVSAQLAYMLALWLCRLSGIAFYQRLNPRTGPYSLILKLSIAFVTSIFITQTLIIALQCIPLSALWGATKGKCIGSKAVFYSTASMTIICDSLILLLPIYIIFTIQANLTRKVALASVMCFGIFTSICRILAMIPAIEDSDATWYFSVVMVWSDTEVSTAIIALSLPALKGLFSGMRNKRKALSEDGRYGTLTEDRKMENFNRFRHEGNQPSDFYGGRTSERDSSGVVGNNPSDEALWREDI
ncbi:conserved hypothetical protein [Talaromyces stipitatus ATCC 10500]|uniref:Rhodopsin domain-containing protein n=1 Tax=Talaromyces stipitatus (strain ATCC 10500 / CBS 375.48 / QM 6759 / NRRL 1006) TaxID=441959 RepID=B8MUQ0_TALSN|nr:uncharacterized protein TSTA_109090 [Talaromyces stipitatus ATCC 10500]EED11730.1 conserved hypothetical protein [Talaromyces stipitatus ATCC 10500]